METLPQTGQPGTQLTVIERAAVALKSTEYESRLKALAVAYADITEIRDRVSYDQVHGARMELKRARIDVKTFAEEVREEAKEFSKAVIAEAGRLIAIVSPEEERLQALQDAYDAQQEALKKAKAEAEQKRIAALQERIDQIRAAAIVDVSKTNSDEVREIIRQLEGVAIDESFQEVQPQAEGAKTSTLMRLRLILNTVVGNETEAKRLAEERERLARERAEQEAVAAAERARLAREKAEQDAAAAKERERVAEEERQAKARRDEEYRQHQEQLRQQRERAEREESQRRALLEQEERDAAVRRAAAERAEAARQAELDRQEAERQAEEARLQAQREELERREEAIAQVSRPAAGGQVKTPAILNANDTPETFVRGNQAQPRTYGDMVIERAATLALRRPSDDQIIRCLAEHFFEPESTVIDWILDMEIVREERSAAA